MSPVELKRLKKEFLNLCRLKPPSGGKNSFGDAFLEFLNSSVNNEWKFSIKTKIWLIKKLLIKKHTFFNFFRFFIFFNFLKAKKCELKKWQWFLKSLKDLKFFIIILINLNTTKQHGRQERRC